MEKTWTFNETWKMLRFISSQYLIVSLQLNVDDQYKSVKWANKVIINQFPHLQNALENNQDITVCYMFLRYYSEISPITDAINYNYIPVISHIIENQPLDAVSFIRLIHTCSEEMLKAVVNHAQFKQQLRSILNQKEEYYIGVFYDMNLITTGDRTIITTRYVSENKKALLRGSSIWNWFLSTLYDCPEDKVPSTEVQLLNHIEQKDANPCIERKLFSFNSLSIICLSCDH